MSSVATGAATGHMRRHPRLKVFLERYGLVLALVAAVLIFTLLRPDVFPTYNTFRSILVQAAVPIILAVGLTVTLALGDFDLSIGSMLGLGGASAVALMSLHGFTWQAAIAVGLALGVGVGIINGIVAAYLGASSFVTTLGMGTALLGVEYLFTSQNTLYENIQPGYLALGKSVPFWGINVQVWVALLIAIVVWIALERTEFGRHVYAVGGNKDAARFAGLPVARLRMIGFIIVALAAAICGILMTAQGGSSSPNAGVPYLLPAYTAAFLGSAAFRPGDFNVAGTVVAALFIGVISTGLQLVHIPTAVINILQGVILVVAVLLSRLEKQR